MKKRNNQVRKSVKIPYPIQNFSPYHHPYQMFQRASAAATISANESRYETTIQTSDVIAICREINATGLAAEKNVAIARIIISVSDKSY